MTLTNLLKKTIIAQVSADVDYSLSELDIEGMIQNLISKKEINKAVEQAVQEKIASIIQDKAFMKIQKQMPIIDAWTNEKVTEFLYSLGVK